jgi:ATP-dependent Clp protease ATP-binding subunit ClpA
MFSMWFWQASSMNDDIQVSIYFGPLSWFHEQLGDGNGESLLEVVYQRDEAHRRVQVIAPGQPATADDEDVEPPESLSAESGDYASLNEHVITNFAGLIRLIRPRRLHLHNPPAQVHAQLERIVDVKVSRYEYPSVTKDTLVRFRDGFSDHLVGQRRVRELLLAALYPLATPKRTTPVVLMFYGPSGVGKTETAQFVNSLLGGTLLRKQFSMFHSDKFASYLFGGTHSEPSLAHDLLDRDSGVILIDEFDKANPVFHSAFYQLFDGGAFEDKNYTVQLGPALIICTSNYSSDKEVREALGDALYSRFDAVIQFERLSPDEITQVINRLVDARFSSLTDVEQQRLDSEQVKRDLYPLAKHPGNVRTLGKTVDQMISLLLVRSLLAQDSTEIS